MRSCTPVELFPLWETFRPLPKGASYPVLFEFPIAMVNHGEMELERIRREEAELLRKRLVLVNQAEEIEEIDAKIQEWRKKEDLLAQVSKRMPDMIDPCAYTDHCLNVFCDAG